MSNMSKHQKGFTLVEIVIVMAISALLVVSMVGAYNQNVKIERFSGGVREIASRFNASRTASVSIRTTPACLNQYCLGEAIEIDRNNDTITFWRLIGDDVSRHSAYSQPANITGRELLETLDLPGMDITDVRVGGISVVVGGVTFYSPDGQGNTGTILPHTAFTELEIVIDDDATDLTALITFNPESNQVDFSI